MVRLFSDTLRLPTSSISTNIILNSLAHKGFSPTPKKSWFGSWLGGKKDGESLKQPQSSGPIRAKLGEENSFYYDENLKKWVNRKGGSPQAAEAPKPPPPRGGPSRTSGRAARDLNRSATTPAVPTAREISPPEDPQTSHPPPINPSIGFFKPSTSSTPPSPTRSVSSAAALPSTSLPQPSVLLSPSNSGLSLTSGPPSAPHSAPPSRPATGMSNASSIDDLIGAPQPRKGGTVRKVKKGRGYVDVMAK